jgi:hypothetical protein
VSCRVVMSSAVGRLEARHKIHTTLLKINYGVSRGVLFCCVVLFLPDVNRVSGKINIVHVVTMY